MSSVTPPQQPGSSSPFDSVWLNKVAVLLRDLIIANVALAFGNISVLGVKPFDFLTQWGHDLQQKASDAYTGQQTANAKADGTATVLGLGSGNDLLGTLNPSSIWSNIITAFLNPSGLLKDLTSRLNFAGLLNNLFDGTTGNTGSTGKTTPDVLSALQTQTGLLGGIGANAASALSGLGGVQAAISALTPSALTAFEQSVFNTLTLGQRANKSAAMGANPTSQTSFTLGHFSAAGSLSTTLAAGTAIAQRFTVPETATNGFIEILAAGSGITNIFVNIFKINPTTNAKTALFNSSNIASLIPTTMTDHTRTLLPGMPAVAPGDELLLEIANGGSNALTLATKTTGAPNNSHEVIQNVGFSRSIASTGGTSPTSLTAGQGGYTGTVPYAIIGIANVPADYHPPESNPYLPHGSYSYTLPSWLDTGDFIDLVGVGGGGAGQGEQGYNLGQGGHGGVWNAKRLIIGTDIAVGGTVTITVGRGGPQQVTYFANGVDGTATVFTWAKPGVGTQTLTCAGGAGGRGAGFGYGGGSPGDTTWQGQPYYGGVAVGSGSVGNGPGGGGGGAPPYLFGGAGADGEAWTVGTQA